MLLFAAFLLGLSLKAARDRIWWKGLYRTLRAALVDFRTHHRLVGRFDPRNLFRPAQPTRKLVDRATAAVATTAARDNDSDDDDASCTSTLNPCLPNMTTELVLSPDGETSVVWWSAPSTTRPTRSAASAGEAGRTGGGGSGDAGGDGEGTGTAGGGTSTNVWVILPGGMTSGDCFYVRDAVASGVFGNTRFCVFHNPGIINKVTGVRPPAGLTETTYVLCVLCVLCVARRVVV